MKSPAICEARALSYLTLPLPQAVHQDANVRQHVRVPGRAARLLQIPGIIRDVS
jgi:hypothetical protein